MVIDKADDGDDEEDADGEVDRDVREPTEGGVRCSGSRRRGI